MRLALLIRSLDQGGAQQQVVNFVKSLHLEGNEVAVCTFYSGGDFEAELIEKGVTIFNLGKKGRWDVLRFFLFLVRTLRKFKPCALQSYLGTANVVSVLIKPFLSDVRVVWGIRASNMDLSEYDWFWRFSYFLERNLARFADLIIANSFAGLEFSVSNGFPKEKMVFIPNGIDTDKFFPEKEGKQGLRAEWSVGEDDLLIGLVARLDPKKDHMNFLRAAAKIVKIRKNVKFVCVGRGDKRYFEKLRLLSEEGGMAEYLIWAGPRRDMDSVYNSLDMVCLSSAYGEGFPNVLGEAMSCGVPCVATDVGDSALIIGDTGIIVPPGNPDLLAEAMEETIHRINEEGTNLSLRVRQRIVDNFGVGQMVSSTKSEILSII